MSDYTYASQDLATTKDIGVMHQTIIITVIVYMLYKIEYILLVLILMMMIPNLAESTINF